MTTPRPTTRTRSKAKRSTRPRRHREYRVVFWATSNGARIETDVLSEQECQSIVAGFRNVPYAIETRMVTDWEPGPLRRNRIVVDELDPRDLEPGGSNGEGRD